MQLLGPGGIPGQFYQGPKDLVSLRSQQASEVPQIFLLRNKQQINPVQHPPWLVLAQAEHQLVSL